MERFTTKRYRLRYNQYFQERAQQVEEESDGILHGPAGPPGPMALSALKISEEQARPHLVYVIEAQFQNSKRPAMSDLLQPA